MTLKINPNYLVLPGVLIIAVLLVKLTVDTKQSTVTDNHEVIYSQVTDKPFQDVVDDAEFAISEKNFRITNQLKIGKAVRERGNNEFPENNVILFCNIQYAEKMLLLEPDYLNYCPGQIAIRQAADHVVVSAPLVPYGQGESINALVDEVNQLIIEAVDFSAKDWQTHEAL